MAFGGSGLRLSALFPIGCATAAFVLTMLCLFAGKNQGFMEDYHILMVSWLRPSPTEMSRLWLTPDPEHS
jgi:hypothetical protein